MAEHDCADLSRSGSGPCWTPNRRSLFDESVFLQCDEKTFYGLAVSQFDLSRLHMVGREETVFHPRQSPGLEG
jgi:hypothetical protein